jgi:hypothetical protein
MFIYNEAIKNIKLLCDKKKNLYYQDLEFPSAIDCSHAQKIFFTHRKQSYLVERVDQMDHYVLNPLYLVPNQQE